MKAKNIGNLIKSLALSAAMCAPLMAGIGFGDNVKAAENWVNIHRLCSKSGVHRYTTDGDCYKKAEWGSYNYEGIAYRGVTDPSQGVPVYEMLRSEANSSDPVPGSLLSTDQNEVRVLNSKYRNGVGWSGGNVLFYAPKTSDYPVHRLFYPRAADPRTAHHYTADANEIRVLVTQGWNDEGIVFYSAGPGEAASTSPSTGGTIVSNTTGRSKEIEDAYFEELNKIRVSEGLKPYIRNAQMDAAAGSRMDYIIAGFDSGMNVAYKKAQDELKAQGLPYLGFGDSKNMLPPSIHDGAEEAFNKYNTDSSIVYYSENAGHDFVYGTASASAKKALSSTKTYSETYNTAHWPHLMSKQYTQIGIAMYVRGEDLFTCVQFAAPSDGSTLAGVYYDADGTGWYFDPAYPNARNSEESRKSGIYYILDKEMNEFGKFWQKKFEEGYKSNMAIVEEFRKMKDGK